MKAPTNGARKAAIQPVPLPSDDDNDTADNLSRSTRRCFGAQLDLQRTLTVCNATVFRLTEQAKMVLKNGLSRDRSGGRMLLELFWGLVVLSTLEEESPQATVLSTN